MTIKSIQKQKSISKNPFSVISSGEIDVINTIK